MNRFSIIKTVSGMSLW